MRKFIHTKKMQWLFLALFCIFTQAGAREIYVSPTGFGSGDGSDATNPVNFARLLTILGTAISDNTINVHFAGGEYTVAAALAFNYPRFDGKVLYFKGEGTNAAPAILKGSGINQLVALSQIRGAATRFTFVIYNMVIQDFTNSSNTNFLIGITAGYNTIKLNEVTIKNCDNTNGSNRLLSLSSPNGHLVVSNSSIINNNRGSGTLLELSNGTCLFYNNTVSENTASKVSSVTNLATADRNFKLFNNTFYNTGQVHNYELLSDTYTAYYRLMNNIIAGSSTVSGDNTPADRMNMMLLNNIIGTSFYPAGNSSGTSTTFTNDFTTSLTPASDGPGRQVHLPKNSGNTSHSLARKGLSYDFIKTETSIDLTTDQLGSLRPLSEGLTLGSVEFDNLRVRDPNIYIINDLVSGIPLKTTVEIDLETLVHVPSEIGSVTFVLDQTMAAIGTLSPLTGDNKTTFTLASGLTQNATGTFTYKIMKGTTEQLATGEITVNYAVFDTRPPGYLALASGDCFAYMGAVNFTSAYRFKTNEVTGNGTGSGNRLYGFSIPLVADLNGDGYPEIIAISTAGAGSIHGHYNGIYIYDGRTGKKIAKRYFPGCNSTSYYSSSGFHGSPSIMALVDSDKNETVEVIVAFPDGCYPTTNSRYRSKVASFDLPYDGGDGTLTEKWISSDTYNSGSGDYEKTTPQVVDLDGDGTPEVLVYNKIYNANPSSTPASPLLTLETITTANLGRSVNAPGGSGNSDQYLAFPYIYDMDGDGIYDIVAGGKIYKITKSGSTFSTPSTPISMSGVTDGYTGVADIDGDGKADVVVVSRAGTNSDDDVVIKVWNPGFNAAGVANPYLITSRNISVSDTYTNNTGSNSYVYIGDIDGREQLYNGKTYRLPEIAILTRRVVIDNFPRHPNIDGIPAGDGSNQGGIPNTYTWVGYGCIFALTYDVQAGDLKGSFIMEHDDRSINTGFTMFDFDNDGVQEICYRDMNTLRIIKPTIPFVKQSYTKLNKPDVIKFSEPVQSYTGFEYPVIADIDNDASAEMVVMGYPETGDYGYGYVYAVGSGDGDKFSPALPVWNQFMYDPFKINPDLTTPRKSDKNHAIDRLSPQFTFSREVRDENSDVIKTIERYNPFNGTLLQASYFTALPSRTGASLDFDPIVYLTQAYIADNDDPDPGKRPQITGSSSPYIEITIANRAGAKTDIRSEIPLAVYKNNRVSKATYVKKYLLSELEYWTGSAWTAFGETKSVPGGGSVRVRIPLGTESSESIYIIRLGDASDTTPATPVWRWGLNDLTEGTPNPTLGIGVVTRRFRDCDWDDQMVRAARHQAIDDTQTVQEFRSVRINVWDNDILPDTYFTGNPSFADGSDTMKITMQPQAGTLTFSGTGRNSRIEYHHNGKVALTEAIDSFRYRVHFWDSSRVPAVHKEDTATVYIYVLESTTGGFAACHGEETTITLADKPEGVSFDWYKATSDTLITNARSRTIRMYGDSTYRIHPLMPDGKWGHLDFPWAKLSVLLATTSSSHAVMRWTGLIDHNWKNPGNWVEVKGSYEAPVSWVPTGCVNVIIPSGATKYPELTDTVWCGHLTMKDRAMLRNPHVLKYSDASVEFKLTPAEKDRFVMWSAPLKNMYSGDYHFKKKDGTAPNWGDTYMMFFQMGNPDASNKAVKHTMTATVGDPGVALTLGTAFNFRLTATSLNRDSVLKFPKTADSYIGTNAKTYPASGTFNRTHKGRFITDGFSGSGFSLPVTCAAGSEIVQVVNPYMAWLNVGPFLTDNNATLNTNAYVAWDGDVNGNLVSYYKPATQPVDTLRYWIPSVPAGGTNVGWIAPLKSFFVILKDKQQAPSELKMSPAWTTTTTAPNPYSLRAATAATPGLLYIRASQGGKSSSTLLRYDPDAIANYRETEDVYQIFYDGTDGTDGVALTLYSLAPWGEALAINSSGNFSSRPTPLGLRVRDAGEVKLEFSGVQSFGHDIWLTDKVLKSETDLKKTGSYTFTVTKTGNKLLDITDRFSLYMKYTGNFTGSDTPSVLPQWIVSSREGYIDVQSVSGDISDLQVYDVAGALVYHSRTLSSGFRIPAAQGIYIVKARFGDEQKVEKVFVR